MPNVKHKKASAKADGADASLVRPSDWNDEHVVDQYLDLPTLGAPPAAPAASPGDTRLFGRNRGGRRMLSMVGPSGLDTALQPALFSNGVALWLPGTGTTAAINFGVPWTVAATQAHPQIAATNFHAQIRRATYTTAATAGSASGVRAGAPVCFRGGGSGMGGFYAVFRFGFVALVSGMQFWAGLSATSAALAGDPSAVNNTACVGMDAADTNLQLVFRDGAAATKVNLGAAPVADHFYEAVFFCPPSGSSITARVQRLNDGVVLADNTVHTANVVQATALLYPRAEVRNGAAAAAAAISLSRIYVETDN